MKRVTTLLFYFLPVIASAQSVGIGTSTPNTNAILELSSPSKGFLMPRVSDANMNAMLSPAPGMMLYNTNLGRAYMYVGSWQKIMLDGDPFSLPYSGAGSSGAALFSITQTDPSGTAGAIFGNNTQNGYGIFGNAESGDGIVGVSNSGTGGRFTSTTGKALIANGTVWLNNSGGKTMIGNLSTPVMQLHVSSAADTSLLQLDNNTSLAAGVTTGMYFKTGSWYTGAIKTTGTGSNVARLSFWTFANTNTSLLKERMSILDNGNVGINTINPQTTLDVNGTVKISGGSPGAGKVLISDAAGVASWSGTTAFTAYKTLTSNTTVNGLTTATIAFDVEDYDLGPSSVYNNATNVFTAPVAGVYHFDVSVTVNPQVAGQSLRIRLVKNNTVNVRDVAIETQNLFTAYSIPFSADVNLAAGEDIRVSILNFSSSPVIIAGQTTSSGSPATFFSGHLVR